MRKWLILVIALPAALLAQGPRGMATWWESPWWNSPLARNLNLTEAQQNDIRATVKDYRERLSNIRTVIQKADSDVENAFAEDPIDQRKANEAIDRLANGRADLTRTISQMSLKLRSVLTAEQWQELQRQQPGFGGPRGGGRRGPGRAPPGLPPGSLKQTDGRPPR